MKAVLDAERLRVHAARGLIDAGASGGRDDVDAVISLIETRGFVHDGNRVTLIFGLHEGKERISHTERLRIEQSVAEMSRAAARDRSANLSDAAIRAAIERVEANDAGVRFSNEQLAAIHALGAGGKTVAPDRRSRFGKNDASKAAGRRLARGWPNGNWHVDGLAAGRRPPGDRRRRDDRASTAPQRDRHGGIFGGTRTPSLSSTKSARSVPARC